MSYCKILTIIICAVLLSRDPVRAAPEPTFVQVSLVSLIATPEKFDGKYVLVQGVAHMEQKYSLYAVYLTREDKLASNDKNAVYLMLAPSIGKVDHLNGRYVMARGLFRADIKGRLDAYCGSLDEVDLIRKVDLDK